MIVWRKFKVPSCWKTLLNPESNLVSQCTLHGTVTPHRTQTKPRLSGCSCILFIASVKPSKPYLSLCFSLCLCTESNHTFETNLGFVVQCAPLSALHWDSTRIKTSVILVFLSYQLLFSGQSTLSKLQRSLFLCLFLVYFLADQGASETFLYISKILFCLPTSYNHAQVTHDGN